MPVQDPKMTLVAKRLLRIPKIAILVAAVLVVAVLYTTFHDTYADSRQNSTISDSSQDVSLADIGREDLEHRITELQLAQTTLINSRTPSQTGEAVYYLELNNSTLQGNAKSVSFSPSEDVLAVVIEIENEPLVRIYDTSNWEEIEELQIEGGNIFESRFSPDGRFLVWQAILMAWKFTIAKMIGCDSALMSMRIRFTILHLFRGKAIP